MKTKYLLLICILAFPCNIRAQDKYHISWDYSNQSFNDFASRAESQFNIRFLYKGEWVKDLKLASYPGCTNLTCILDNLFKNTALHYFIDNSQNIIVTKDYIITDPGSTQDRNKIVSPPAERTGYNLEQQVAENEYVIIGNRSERNKPGKVTISGYVTNMETGKREAGVTVFVRNISAGTNTDQNGFYSLTLPRGSHEIKFSFIGLKEKNVILNIYESGQMNLYLDRSIVSLKEIVVSAQVNVFLERTEAGIEKVNIRSFKLLPTSLGEADIIKSVNLMPGVQSVGEGSAGFNVRGGSADQNLILLCGAPLYNSTHFFGFFSAVNSDIIKDITLYKGGIPGRYGGRISSVLDIETRDGNSGQFTGSAGISPVTTHLLVEGPVIKDTLSFLSAVRTTYSNWMLNIIKDTLLHGKKVSFYDLNLKITYNINNTNKLDASSYFSHDYFRLSMNNIYSYNNNIQVLRWSHDYTRRFSSIILLSNSYYGYDVSNQDLPDEAYRLSHNINSSLLKTDFNWLRGIHKINFGLDLTRYAVLPGRYEPTGTSSRIIAKEIEDERAFEGALYVEDKFNLTKSLSINAGMRMSSFLSLGPQTVYKYDPGLSKRKMTIIDTLIYGAGELTSRYGGPELRVSLNYRIAEKSSFRINYNRTRQYIHLLSNSASISPTDTWKICDYYLKPETGNQYAAGFYRMLFGNTLETSVEVYYKEIKNMIDFKGGSTLTMADDIEQYMVDVKGKAYGIELSLKKNKGKTLYSVSYTLARSLLKSISGFKDEIINSGNWYPSDIDRPNNLVITYQYFYSRRFSFSADYVYYTGRPITIPISTYYVNGIKMMHYSDRNKYRIPDYSRLDISLKISGNLRSDKIANPNLTISVFNLLGKENAYSVFFKKYIEGVKGYKLSVFGRPFPTVTLNFDF